MGLGTSHIAGDKHARKGTLTYRLDGPVDLHMGAVPSEKAARLAASMTGVPSWRLQMSDGMQKQRIEDEATAAGPKNQRWPRVSPAWLKHDKHVLRFYCFFQESVADRNDENCRYRRCTIQFYMEDGTIQISEPKIENSGIPQGQFLKRHRVPKSDGEGFFGPPDFPIGEDVIIYGHRFHITGCDRFTRWFFEENGVDLGPDELGIVEGQYEKNQSDSKGLRER